MTQQPKTDTNAAQQAGALDVTEEMAEAGGNEIMTYDRDYEAPSAAATRVYRAMATALLKSRGLA